MQQSESFPYFTRLEVEQFRCFKERQVLDLSDGEGVWARWTILLGENGTGKTTLLQMLAMMCTTTRPDASGLPKRPLWAVLGLSTIALHFGGGGRTRFVPSPSGRKFTSSTNTAPLLAAYGAGRAATRRSDDRDTEPDASLFDPAAPLLDAEAWLLQLDHAAAREPAFAAKRDLVTDTLIGILPDVSEIHVREPGWGQKASARPSPGFVECVTPYGTVRMSDLSFGYQAMTVWVLDFVARLFEAYPDSETPLAEPVIVLVDEIDLHMHPAWQRQLLGFLTDRFPATQFIATAHSPLVVQAAADQANLVLLRRKDDHVEIVQDLESVRGWRIDQLLTSELFGLDSARSPQVEDVFRERSELLQKSRRTAKDKARLAELNQVVHGLPTAQSPEQQETQDLLAETLRVLKKQVESS